MKRAVLRKYVQFAAIGFTFLIPFLNKKGIAFIAGTLYSLAVGPVWITDPAVGSQTLLSTTALDGTLLLSMSIPVAVALVFGRGFCSWVCPQNTLSELFDSLADRFRIKRLFILPSTPLVRYGVLVSVFTASLVLKFPVISLLSAPGIISVQAANFVYETAVGLELSLIAVIAVLELFVIRRIWCNHLCPVGGFLGLFRVPRTMKVVFAESPERPCGGCRACQSACRLGLDPMEKKLYPFCTNCGDCIGACEQMTGKKNPLHFEF